LGWRSAWRAWELWRSPRARRPERLALAASERLRATTSLQFSPADQESFAAHVAAAREAAGSEHDFAAAWAAGELIPPDALIAEILGAAVRA
jgi:hypothetical protein